MRRLLRSILILGGCAVLGHLAHIVAYPRLIMAGTMNAVQGRAGAANKPLLPPLPTDTSRGVVKPSPDLLYALCVYDLAKGPVVVSAMPSADYWSVALYAGNTDNFFVLNDRQAAGKPVTLVIADREAADDKERASYGAARWVRSPPHEA